MLDFWERYLKALENEGISQADVCRRTGIYSGTLSSWIKNGRYPAADLAVSVARAAGVSVEYLVEGEGAKSDLRERFRRWISEMDEAELAALDNILVSLSDLHGIR